MTPDATRSAPPDATRSHDATHSHDPDATHPHPAGPVNPPPGFADLAELGRGAMGVVYKATQPGLNRPVAVKMLLGEAADPRHALRFLAEAEAVAAVDHPHVVRVYEFGRRDSRPFLSMEYLPGGTLADHLKAGGGRKSAVEAATLVEKLARGVAAAHAAGIVHRDLKPGNVLFDAAGEPKVTDFGLAKRGTGADLTRTNAVMGTPAYMSPEQARGEGKFVGPPADVWALGVILYECLTGRRPFEAADSWALLQAVIAAEPSPLRSRAGDVPRDLEQVVAKCLRKEPGERYPSATELAEDLWRHLSGEPVQARPVPTAVRAVKWARRNPKTAVLLGCLVLMGAVFPYTAYTALRNDELNAGVITEQGLRLGEERTRAEAEAKAAAEARKREEAATASALEARRMLGRAATAEGLRRADAGDGLRPLAWFARALQFVPADAIDDLSRDRIAAFRNYRMPILNSINQSQLLDLRHHNNREIRIDNGLRKTKAERRTSTAQVWDTVTNTPATPPFSHATFQIYAAAFGPDGRRVVTAADNNAQVWDAANGRAISPPLKHSGSVASAVFSPDGRRVVTGSYDCTARVWDAITGEEVMPPIRHDKPIYQVAFGPDGRRVLIAGDGYSQVWDVTNGQPVTFPMIHTGRVENAKFSPDGRKVIIRCNDDTGRVWDLAAGGAAHNRLPLPDSDQILAVAMLSGGRQIAIAVNNVIVVGPDGRRVAIPENNHTARVWDVATKTTISPPLRHAKRITTATVSPDGRLTATASEDGFARVWDVTLGAEVTPPLKHKGWIYCVSFSPDGRWLATGGSDRTAIVWDTTTGKAVTHTLPHDGGVHSVALSPDGRRLITAGDGRTVRLWDVATGQPILPHIRFTHAVLSAVFSPDGRKVATGGHDGSARVWDATTRKAITPLLPHAREVKWVAFSPDSKRVATMSEDDTTRVWDASTGEAVTLPLPSRGAHSVAFGADGRSLIVVNSPSVDIWELPTDTRPAADLIKLAHLYAGGRVDDAGGFVPLTADEFKALFAELSARCPADFTVPPARAAAWHREQAAAAEKDRDAFAAAFHLRILLKDYVPADAALAARLRAAEAGYSRERLPPPRPK